MKLETYKKLMEIGNTPVFSGKRDGIVSYDCKEITTMDNAENFKMVYDIKNDVWLTVQDGEIKDIMISCFSTDTPDKLDMEKFIRQRKEYMSGKRACMDIADCESLVKLELMDHLVEIANMIKD